MKKRGLAKGNIFLLIALGIIILGILYYFSIRIENKETQPVYNAHIAINNLDIYTISKDEKDFLVTLLGNDTDKGIIGCSLSLKSIDTIELFRIYNPNDPKVERRYLTDRNEINILLQEGWIEEGSLGYIFKDPGKDKVPIYKSSTNETIGYLYSVGSRYCPP